MTRWGNTGENFLRNAQHPSACWVPDPEYNK